MREATVIVLPAYIAMMIGVAAIKISARKLYQCDSQLNVIKSCARKSTDDVTMDFLDLVALIDTRAKLDARAKL